MSKQIRFFDLIPKRLVDWLLERGDLIVVSPHETVLEQGHMSHGIYIVLKGQLNIILKINRDSKTISQLLPGDIFGEVSFLGEHPIIASVQANTEAHLLLIKREKLSQLFEKNLEFSAKFYKAISILVAKKLIQSNNALWKSNASKD